MIYDSLLNIKNYKSIPYLKDILDFLETHDLLQLPEGDIEILGRDLYLRVLSYFPEDEQTKKFETHQVYADIQIVLGGVEKIQTAGRDNLTPVTEYDAQKDIQFFSVPSNQVSDIIVRENQFALFFVGETHKPQCFYEKVDEPIKKFVFKVKN